MNSAVFQVSASCDINRHSAGSRTYDADAAHHMPGKMKLTNSQAELPGLKDLTVEIEGVKTSLIRRAIAYLVSLSGVAFLAFGMEKLFPIAAEAAEAKAAAFSAIFVRWMMAP